MRICVVVGVIYFGIDVSCSHNLTNPYGRIVRKKKRKRDAITIGHFVLPATIKGSIHTW